MVNAKVDCLLKVLSILGCKASIKQRVAILEALQELQKGKTMSDEKAEQKQIPNRPPQHELPASTKLWQGRMPHPTQSDGHCPCRVVRYYTWVLRRTATQLEWQAEQEYVFEASVTRDHMGGWRWEPRDFTDLPEEFFAETLEAFECVRKTDDAPSAVPSNPLAEETAGPTSTKIERLLATARHEATTAERERYGRVLTAGMTAAIERGGQHDRAIADTLLLHRDEILYPSRAGTSPPSSVPKDSMTTEEAVNKEKQRCAEAIHAAIREAQKRGEYSLEEALRVCLTAIVTPSRPTSQPPPMTLDCFPRFMEKWAMCSPRSNAWHAMMVDLHALVEEQAKRNAAKPPMTDTKVIANLMKAHETIVDNLEKDIAALVDARPGWDLVVSEKQTRRDAALCCYACKQTILKEAGLQ